MDLPPAPAETLDDVVVAEYNRLSEELQKLTQRGAWAGVERTFVACEATGHPLSFEDNLAGAYSARVVGNVTAVRARLLRAHDLVEDREILDWVWDIDHNYGRVYLAADVGKAELQIEKVPFNPDQARAWEYARDQIAATGVYDGFLPAGDYLFGGIDLEVVPRVQTARIDLRTNPERAKKRKKQK